MRNIPIRAIDFEVSSDKKMHEGMVKLVSVMLALQAKLDSASTVGAEVILRQIEATDRAIDTLVAKLYGVPEHDVQKISTWQADVQQG